MLYRALTLAQSMRNDGVTDAEAIRRKMRSLVESEPLAHIDYVSVADANTLEELASVPGEALASLAVRIGRTRLIDNLPLERSG